MGSRRLGNSRGSFEGRLIERVERVEQSHLERPRTRRMFRRDFTRDAPMQHKSAILRMEFAEWRGFGHTHRLHSQPLNTHAAEPDMH